MEYCSQCGLCESFPSQRLEEICPREQRPVSKQQVLGEYEDVTLTKGKSDGTYSGSVPSILKSMLKNELADEVVGVTRGRDIIKGKPAHVSDSDKVKKLSGMRHTVTSLFSDFPKQDISKQDEIAITGLPCHLKASSKLQEQLGYNVKYKIGIACGTNYDYRKFRDLLEEEGIDLEGIEDYTLRETKKFTPYFEFKMNNGEKKTLSVSKTIQCIPDGCKYCKDYLGYNSDISFGILGAPRGYSIAFVRNDKGKELVNTAVEEGYIEVSEPPQGILHDLTSWFYKSLPGSFYLPMAFKTSLPVGAELMAKYKYERLEGKIEDLKDNAFTF